MGQGSMKTPVLRSLARLRLLRPAYRGYERLRAVGQDGKSAVGETLPVPPARLRIRVAGTADLDWFLDSGRLAEETLRGSLARAGTSLEDQAAILDFGCGCGRVIRRLAGLPGDVHGSDFDGAAVAWCRENLPFASFTQNGLEPPLPLPDADVSLVYAFSVLTHLPVPVQHAWVEELTRIMRPGGLLLVSTHGERYLERLSAAEREAFRRGEIVVRFEEVAGTNLCTTFHPPISVRERLGAKLELVEEVPEGATGNPHQDLFLFRKPAGGVSPSSGGGD
jgi:SAM-dependent methyltransferase